jgi:hypothetical protein
MTGILSVHGPNPDIGCEWLTGCIHGYIVDAMLAIRTILAVLIAISLALAPAAAGAAISLSSGGTAMADHADMPCCPDCGTQQHPSKTNLCILSCAVHVGIVLPAVSIALPRLIGEPVPFFKADNLRGMVQSPPTHPPKL